ncbi:unnamed protein product, partial [Strongylus vulgaris]
PAAEPAPPASVGSDYAEPAAEPAQSSASEGVSAAASSSLATETTPQGFPESVSPNGGSEMLSESAPATATQEEAGIAENPPSSGVEGQLVCKL